MIVHIPTVLYYVFSCSEGDIVHLNYKKNKTVGGPLTWKLSYSFNNDWKNLELTGQNSTMSNKTHQCRHGSVILQYIMN